VMSLAAESCIIDKEDAKHHLTVTQRVSLACLAHPVLMQTTVGT
jgi:hypothetical protein